MNEEDSDTYISSESTTKYKPFYKLSMFEILINMKNTWFEIMDDITRTRVDSQILTKNNRLFYVGLTLLILAIIMFMYDYSQEEDPIVKLLQQNNNNPLDILKLFYNK